MAGRAELPNLTAQDRILLHLSEHSMPGPDYEAPPDVASKGLADAVGIEPKHLPQNIRPLILRGLVIERTAHVKGSRQRRKVFLLTAEGRSDAARLRGTILDVPVEVEVQRERRSMVLRDAVKEHFRGTPLLRLLEVVASRGFLSAPVPAETSAGPSPDDALQLPPVRLALEKVKDLEKHYDWTRATDALRAAITHLPRDQPGAVANLSEQVAHAQYRAAFQGDTPEDFKKRMERALASYRQALQAYATLGKWGNPRTLRCKAMIDYAGFWLAKAGTERKRLLLELQQGVRAALGAFEKTGEPLEFGRAYNELTLNPEELALLWDRVALVKILRDGIEHGERAVQSLVSAHDPDELARAYTNAANYLGYYGMSIADDPAERNGCCQTALEYWKKARELSDDCAHLALARPFLGDGSDESLAVSNRALQLATATGDRYLIGYAGSRLAFHTSWRFDITENPADRANLLELALGYAQEAKRQFDTLGVPGTSTGNYASESYYDTHYVYLADLEVDPRKKVALLEKALLAAQEGLTRARELAHEGMEAAQHFGMADVLLKIATIETRSGRKKQLLEEGLSHARESARLYEEGRGGVNRWNRALPHIFSAEAAAALAAWTEEPKARERALRDAISNMEAGLELWIEEQKFWERQGDLVGYRPIGDKQYAAGHFLRELWESTRDPADLSRAAAILEKAAASYAKAGLESRVAECHWRISQVQDLIGNHQKASHHFRLASEAFEAAGKKIPHLQELYKDLALYMNAWSEIEGARHHHARAEYGRAREYYEKSADLLRFCRRWSSFASNYAAWAALEKAEDLSRRDLSEEAGGAFQQAAQLFAETRNSLDNSGLALEDLEQRNLAAELAKASDVRGQYCRTRIVLEEARILEKQGDYPGSSDRYSDAAEMLDEIARALSDERDRHEMKLIMTSARAWQTMARAAANASPESYADAARLFEEAREISATEGGKRLAAAHSHFCWALASGAEFSETRNAEQHAAAVRHLEIAADAYETMGLSGASHYAKASKLLFDGYVYLDRANRESDPAGKAKLYAMTEHVLRASADAYARAERPAKQAEVLGLLARVKEERELAVSLSDILRASGIASTTTSFPAPTPTHEKPVGLDRFEHADIQANLLPSHRATAVGQTFELEIEMVNAGRAAAQLVKIEELCLDHFELEQVKGSCVIEEDHLDMKGRRLDPLKTMELTLLLSPREPGTFRLRPRILYLDDRGRYRAHEPDPVEIVVQT